MNKISLLLITGILLICCRKKTIQNMKEKSRGFIAENAMVVSAREEASKIGLDIMKQGGNAFDAMIATDLALLVSYPVAGNIGGGGVNIYGVAQVKIHSSYIEKNNASIITNSDVFVGGTLEKKSAA